MEDHLTVPMSWRFTACQRCGSYVRPVSRSAFHSMWDGSADYVGLGWAFPSGCHPGLSVIPSISHRSSPLWPMQCTPYCIARPSDATGGEPLVLCFPLGRPPRSVSLVDRRQCGLGMRGRAVMRAHPVTAESGDVEAPYCTPHWSVCI